MVVNKYKKHIPFPDWFERVEESWLKPDLEQCWIERLRALDADAQTHKDFQKAEKSLEHIKQIVLQKGSIETLERKIDLIKNYYELARLSS